jgi:hypothetical protein
MTYLLPNLLFVIGIIGFVISFLIVWYKTSLPCLIFHFLRWVGWKKTDSEFWNVSNIDMAVKDWTEDDLMMFYTLRLGLLGHLLSCRYCLSCHVIFWSNLLGYLLCTCAGVALSVWAPVLCLFVALPIVHYCYERLN